MNRLKELRQEKGLTQQALADEIGVTKITILRWEKGDRQIKPEKAQQLADYFGVSVGYLLGYSDTDFNTITSDSYDDNEKKRALQGLDKFLLLSGYLSQSEMITAIKQTIDKKSISKKIALSGVTDFTKEHQENLVSSLADEQTNEILNKISLLTIALSYLDNIESELLTNFYFLPDKEKLKLLEIAKVFRKANTPDPQQKND